MECDLEKSECMVRTCLDCPGEEGTRALVSSNIDLEGEVKYKQWTNTDRFHLIDVLESADEFISNLLSKLWKGRTHHFHTKSQSKFLKDLKERLDPSESIVLCDFAENYNIMIQDAVQGFHWKNDQVRTSPI